MEALQYNSERTPLIIPEYGRHLHIMVNQMLETEDREERNKKAKAIIGVMGNLNPHLRDVPDFQHKLWDQLFIMSDFNLDVDSPFEKPIRELLEERPQPLTYPQNFPKYRFYGNNIKSMIDVARKWEEGEMKDALVFNIANHMKKCFLSWNKDTVDDQVIFNHLTELSENTLSVNPTHLPLTSSEEFLKSKPKNGNGPKSNQVSKPRKGNRNNRKRY
ncbi:DUF4290 domain-containing protein [Flavobacteriaceae bacterium]|jgi:hypothetical protein|uniref:DUF4290 domain-containing protein n=1 Tax=Candidatus Arcticimaribacter forsetii TaxID=2820661 RepID=UPI0020772EB7|nr:DUF4290 domain-containing protein [Candidatus Arcticimaribacter forsetii]MDA8640123.1 DUF4290 domain-containing protein [Flavobacteriaceae bacterium]MDA8699289.1 DUF4290 domain-containing protein [Flavobacteriaceae bacterium]MDB2456905.1 DUF4290 domain-containing protein [Flavobacteriaceae bacterium]MDB4621010.1 DUF4290 domain-containing protein [Flavobacteriaceae bacterium]MDB4643109.1 DUF4290 domain-containing protein [Flavobacteriaceae bacterium]